MPRLKDQGYAQLGRKGISIWARKNPLGSLLSRPSPSILDGGESSSSHLQTGFRSKKNHVSLESLAGHKFMCRELSKKLHEDLKNQLRRVEAVWGPAACLAPLPADWDGAITGSVKGTLPMSHG